MTRTIVAVVWVASALVLLACCASPASRTGQDNGQRGQLLPDGKLADAVLTKDAEHLTLTMTAKARKRHPPDWSGLKVSASCWPGERRLGGFSFDMALVNTNTVNGRRASAVFALKGEPSAIEQISEVIVTEGRWRDGLCYFRLPLSREEVLARFGARASKEELRQLQELRLSRDLESQERALELVLFKLTPSELFRIGVQQQVAVMVYPSPGPVPFPWVCAGAHSVDVITEAVDAVLAHARIDQGCIGRLGQLGWFAPKEQFFRARRALLAAEDPRVRACAVPPPQFSFE
jgi:hypothetical protein